MPDPAASPSARADAEWSRAFAELSHDVRSILGAAKLNLDAFALVRTESEREKTMALLRGSLRQMELLAEDLRGVADVLAAPRPSTRVEHDLLPATRRACDRLAGEAALRQAEMVLEADGVSSHVVTGDAEAWDRTLERLIESGLRFVAKGGRLVISLEPRPPLIALVVPCGSLELPDEGALREVWAAPRPPGRTFARGLWLARSFLVAEGGELAIREEGGQRQLVASLPRAGSV